MSNDLRSSNLTEFFKFWIVDERTGKRRKTTYKLSRANAERQFPGAEADLSSREFRELPDRTRCALRLAATTSNRPSGSYSIRPAGRA